ncbi:807_t:CDS:2 [Ambispora gerdemannii]|uniref:807_t:CDS:1 n=1 Tax=Ambispora gerdemannii TaxID=144530 RepID=A0A9N8WQL0_9GLOM|nr:807_t:CDS:2 [Ambispora gerdemannii]
MSTILITTKTLSTLHICLESIGLLLVTLSIIIILHPHTKPFLTKWTLFQYFLASFLKRILGIPLIAINTTLEIPRTMCIIHGHLSGLLSYPLQMTPAVLAFYLWFAVARNKNMEKMWYSWFTSFVWSVAAIGTLIQVFIVSNDDDWGVGIRNHVCELKPGDYRLWQLIPTVSFATVGLGFASDIWLRQIERTVLGYWYSLSLTSACLLVTVLNVCNSAPTVYYLMFKISYISPIFLWTITLHDIRNMRTRQHTVPPMMLSWPSSNTLTEQRFASLGKSDKMEKGHAADSGVFSS